MARTINRLSTLQIKNLSDPGLYPDGGGLYFRITPKGTRNWIFRYARHGRTRDMGLGSVATLSLGSAREAAAAARGSLSSGMDPITVRERGRKVPAAGDRSFATCAEQFIASHEPSWRNEKHRYQWRATLKTYAYPVLGKVPVSEIDTELVVRVLKPIWYEKSETANRLRGRIETILNWAKVKGMREGQNPAQWRGHLDQLLPHRAKVKQVKHHSALPYAELPGFLKLVRQKSSVSAHALEFVILTAARTGEALGAQWPEIDLEQKLWTVPGARTKTGRDHRIPLSERAAEILRGLAEVRQNEFVFPGHSGAGMSNMALLMLVRRLWPDRITCHGFRSTFKDWAVECTTFANHVSEAALAHVVADKVEAAYRRTDLLALRRDLLNQWATYCS